jgi:uncharacterized protein YbbK (DUF523 family)
VVVSRCLLGECCRYDGKAIGVPKLIRELGKVAEILPVCPEMEVGLPVPRDPIRLVQAEGRVRLIQTVTGVDLTRKMRSFCRQFLATHKPDGFILKARSPSCAVRDALVYHETGIETGTDTAGMFASAVMRCSPLAPMEDDGGLQDSSRASGFLERLLAVNPVRPESIALGHTSRGRNR